MRLPSNAPLQFNRYSASTDASINREIRIPRILIAWMALYISNAARTLPISEGCEYHQRLSTNKPRHLWTMTGNAASLR